MLKDKLNQFYGNESSTKVIYGTILLFAYLIGQEHGDGTNQLGLTLNTFFVAVAIVVAEIYSDIIGEIIKTKSKLTGPERKMIVIDCLAILSVSIWPSLIFLLSNFGLYSLSTAFNLSYAYLMAILIIFSYWAVTISGHTKIKAFLLSFIIFSLGIVAVTIKYVLGH